MRVGFHVVLTCIIVSSETFVQGCAHSQPPCYMSTPAVGDITPPPTARALAAFAMGAHDGEIAPRVEHLCDGRSPTELETPSCSGTERWDTGLVEAHMTEDRVVLREMEAGQQLLWLQTHDAPDGMRLGPVAWVEQREGGVSFRGFGILKAYPHRVDVRVQALAPLPTEMVPRRERDDDEDVPNVTHILLVSSSKCENGETGDECALRMNVLLLDRDALRMPVMLSSSGRCVGPAEITLERHQTNTDTEVPIRRFDYAASPEFEGSGLVIGEQVTVTEIDPAHPEIGERHVREMTSRLRWTLFGLRMMADRTSLWERALRVGGSLEGRSTGTHTVDP